MAETKPARKPRPSRARPKQQHLPGTEPPSIPEIDRLADAVAALCSQRMAIQKMEKDKRDLLGLKLKEHGLKAYEYDGKIAEITETEKVRVRSKKEAEANSDGEEAGE